MAYGSHSYGSRTYGGSAGARIIDYIRTGIALLTTKLARTITATTNAFTIATSKQERTEVTVGKSNKVVLTTQNNIIE